MSPAVRPQADPQLIAGILGNPANQNSAWQWIKSHWPEVEKKFTMSSGAEIVAATRNFCDAGRRDEVQQFFSEHKVPSAERLLKPTTERINACISYRERQQGNLAEWLEKNQVATDT